MAERTDTLIVGGGSAGTVVASRLSEDPARSVTLVEAGPDLPDLESAPEVVRVAFGGVAVLVGWRHRPWRPRPADTRTAGASGSPLALADP
jgi:choline dehydrogenase-like flavoprotein